MLAQTKQKHKPIKPSSAFSYSSNTAIRTTNNRVGAPYAALVGGNKQMETAYPKTNGFR